MSDRRDALAALLETTRKKYGDVVGQAEKMSLTIPRIPTGSMMLDYAFGGSMLDGSVVAGVPSGRITMFWGEKSSGKTTNCLRIVASAQSRCRNCWRIPKAMKVVETTDPQTGEVKVSVQGECDCVARGLYEPQRRMIEKMKGEKVVEEQEPEKEYQNRVAKLKENSFEECIAAWDDLEGAFDSDWATKLGVDVSRLVYMRPETAEEAIDITDPLLRSGTIDLLVHDSLAQMTPSTEIEESTLDWQRGLAARLLNKAVRKWGSATTKCARVFRKVPTQLWINQIRMKMDNYGTKVLPGGMGQGFATSVEIECRSNKAEMVSLKAGNKGEEIEVPKYQDIWFKCVKNKTAPPGVSGFYRQILHESFGRVGTIDEFDQMMRYARHFELVKQDKAKWLLFDAEYKTQTALLDAVKADPELLARVHAVIMKVLITGDK